jgi:hypothetical protein
VYKHEKQGNRQYQAYGNAYPDEDIDHVVSVLKKRTYIPHIYQPQIAERMLKLIPGNAE